MSEQISVSEWLAEWEKLEKETGGEGLTTPELVKLTGKSNLRVQEFLREGVRAGNIKVGKKVVDPDWDLRRRSYTVFTIKKGEE